MNMTNRKPRIIFDKDTILFVLHSLNLRVDKDSGMVVTKKGMLVYDVDGNPFYPKELMGIYKHYFITKASQMMSIM